MSATLCKMIVAVFGCALASFAFAGDRIGEAHNAAHGVIQYWETVSGSHPRRTLKGTITRIVRNTPYDPPWHDGDWNIDVNPSSDYDYLLKNSENVKNDNNRIELEIYTPFPVGNYFQNGDYIESYGWHVEDMGHAPNYGGPGIPGITGGKTELHPFIYMRKGSSDDFKIFLAQDVSGRFSPSEHNINNYFSGFKVDLGGSTRVNLITGGAPSVTHILRESAVVDSANTLFGGTPASIVGMWNDVRSKVKATHKVGEVEFSTSLKKDRMILDPLYYGHFTKRTLPLLTETIATRVDTDAAGRQSLISHVTVQLNDDASVGALAYNNWTYDATVGNSTAPVTAENPANQRVTFDLIYSPNVSLSDSEWVLDVLASNRTRQWSAGERTSPTQLGLHAVQQRDLLQEQRVYVFERSSIELVQTDIGKSFPAGAGKVTTCIIGHSYKTTVTKAHPAVSVGKTRWQVALTRNSAGVPVAAPTPQVVPEGSSVDLGRVTVEVDAIGTLTLTFASMGALYRNPAQVAVYGDTSTGLGELLPVTVENVGIPFCIPHFFDRVNIDLQLEKLYLAYIILKKYKIPTIPPKWPEAFLKDWPQTQIGPLGPPYKWQRNLPKEGLELVAAYRAVMHGEPIDDKLANRLVAALDRVASLPDLRYIDRPKPLPAPAGSWQPHEMPRFGDVGSPKK